MLAKAHFIHVFLKPPPVKSIALLKSLVRNVSGTAIVPPLLIPVDIAVSYFFFFFFADAARDFAGIKPTEKPLD